MIKVENIKINQLSSLPFADRFDLPDAGGLYFALNTCGEVLYIGQSYSIRKRLRKHERGRSFECFGDGKIAWLLIEDKTARTALEKECIQHIKPKLNERWLPNVTSSSKRLENFTPEELKAEFWKPIPGYDELYSVSNLGRIRRDASWKCMRGGMRKAGHILKQRQTLKGYLTVSICRDGAHKGFFVHRIVAAAFVGPLPLNSQVNHKDANKTNNRAENLEYCSRRENLKHARKMGLLPTSANKDWARKISVRVRGSRNGFSKLTESDVQEIRKLLAAGHKLKEIAQKFGVCMQHIWEIKHRRIWKHC